MLNLCHNDEVIYNFVIAFWKVVPSKHTLEGQFFTYNFILWDLGVIFQDRQNEFNSFFTFDILLMKYSLIKRHLCNLKKRLIRCPRVLKRTIILFPPGFLHFIFLNHSRRVSRLENSESTSCFFFEKGKCSHFCENVLILLLERGPWPE